MVQIEKELEDKTYRAEEVGFYTFLKWYEQYIGDLTYKQDDRYTIVLNEIKKPIAYIIKQEENESFIWVVDKNYFNIMKDFDFQNTLPRKTMEIVKKNNKEMMARIITYDYLKPKEDKE